MFITETDWIIGETARLDVQLTDAAGIPVDAADIVLKIKPPGAAIITVGAPTRTAAGTYHHDLQLDKQGAWYYRWESATPLPAVAEGSFTVQPSRFVP